jgi:hypothetical protein
VWLLAGGGKLRWPARNAPLPASIQDGVNRNDVAGLENAHLVGGVVYLDGAPARTVRHAVEVAVDRDHAVTSDAAFETQDRLERSGRESLQLGVSSDIRN